MHLLPLSLRHLAKFADRVAAGRFASDCVQVELADGQFQAAAICDRSMLAVRGPTLPTERYPTPPVLSACPNGATAALVNADALERFARAATTLTRRSDRMDVRAVGIQPAEDVCTLFASDGNGQAPVATMPNERGRFPEVAKILETARSTAGVMVTLPLAELLKLVTALKGLAGPGETTVTLTASGPGKPVLFTAAGEDGTTVEGVIIAAAD